MIKHKNDKNIVVAVNSLAVVNALILTQSVIHFDTGRLTTTNSFSAGGLCYTHSCQLGLETTDSRQM